MKQIIVLLLVLLIAACGTYPAQQEPAQQPVQPAPRPAVQVQPPPSASQPSVPPPQAAQLSKDGTKLQTMISAADGRLRSYSYYYRDQRPDPTIKYPLAGIFKVRGPRMRIDIQNQPAELSARQASAAPTDVSLYEPQIYGDDYYDRFFLNTETKVAYARCDNSLCKNRRGLTQVSFTDYIRKTPKDWRNEIPLETVKIVDTKQIQNQNIMRVQYEIGGQQILQWLETYSMLPIKVEIGIGEDARTIEFENLAPNSVSDNGFEGVAV